jgi:hypothetical protein
MTTNSCEIAWLKRHMVFPELLIALVVCIHIELY